MKVKTSELNDAALDWAVAKCEGHDQFAQYTPHLRVYHQRTDSLSSYTVTFCPSTDWTRGGPLIERECIDIMFEGPEWYAYIRWEDKTLQYDGPTPLIAAMRCYVASKLGDEVEIEDTLTGAHTPNETDKLTGGQHVQD